MTFQQILGTMRRAINDYNMISESDRVAVGVSGGKDSLLLLKALHSYQKFSPQKFEIEAITIDLGFKETSKEEKLNLRSYIESLGVRYTVVDSEIGDVIFNQRKESNPCSLCSKMRRGALNTKAIELGCNKIALGHHADDLVETMLLSLCFEGRLSTFQPVSYMDRTDMTLIRPFIYMDEKNIRTQSKDLPVVFNPCPADKHTKREYMKDLIKHIQKEIPFARERMISAITSPDRYNLWEEKCKWERI